VLDRYAACGDSAEVVVAQEEFLRECFDEMALRKAEEDDLPSLGSGSGSGSSGEESEGQEEGEGEEEEEEEEEEDEWESSEQSSDV
jgi:hypothetical protein